MTKLPRKRLTETLLKKIAVYGLGTAGVCAALVGCSGSSTVEVPTYDPVGSAAKAMEIYDKDADGFVAGDELDNAPALKAAIKNLDANKDGKVSEQEISDRIRAWDKMSVGLTKFSCLVTMDGTPIQGASVIFVPEEFLGDAIQQAEDVTTMVGSAVPRIPKEKRPSPDTPPGVQLGLYKVQISKKEGEQEKIPAMYNSETTLGQEVSNDDWAIQNNKVQFNLKSK